VAAQAGEVDVRQTRKKNAPFQVGTFTGPAKITKNVGYGKRERGGGSAFVGKDKWRKGDESLE